jgi:hypothetical protein
MIRRVAAKEIRPGTGPAMPIIVGVGRSGTTLLRLMLDAHPDLAIPPETGWIPQLLELPATGDALRTAVFQTITGHDSWPDLHLSADALHAEFDQIEPFDLSDGVRALYRLYAWRFGKSRWGDKTTIYCLSMPEVQRVLPEARFIHLIRDGRDVAVSVRPLWFSPGKDVTSIARDWSYRIRAARQQAAEVSHYLEVRYELLVRRPRRELRRICAFIGMPYDRRMIQFHRQARSRLAEHEERRLDDGTLLTKQQRREQQRTAHLRLQRDRVERWRQELTPGEQAEFLGAAGDLLAELGYVSARRGLQHFRTIKT